MSKFNNTDNNNNLNTKIVFSVNYLLTGWESFHRRNNSFREHNTLFSAHMQPCSFYTHSKAHAEYRRPIWYGDIIISYQHIFWKVECYFFITFSLIK